MARTHWTWLFAAMCLHICSDAQLSRPGSPQKLEPLCDLGSRIPDDIIQCGTCQGRCGTKTDPGDLNSVREADLCSCDEFCGYHGDCCQDFEQFCPGVNDKYVESSILYPFVHKHQDFKCVSLDADFLVQVHTLMIHTCPIDNSECKFSEELSEDVNSFVPMYDVNRGVHYISGHCAICNGAKEVVPWGVTLHCNKMESDPDYVNSGVVNSTESLADVTKEGDCSLEYSLSGESRHCKPGVISRCKDSCKNQKLIDLCETGAQDLTLYKEGKNIYTSTDGVYRNPYCALCNGQSGSSTSGLSCGMYSPPENVMGSRPKDLGSFSLTLVFDFDPRKGLTVGEHPPPECSIGEVYVPDEDICRKITCQSGFVLDGSDCIPEPSNITLLITVSFSSEPSAKVMRSMDQGQGNLGDSIQDDVTETMDSFGVTHTGLGVDTGMDYRGKVMKVTSKVTCNCDYQTLFNAEAKHNNQIQEFEQTLAKEVKNDVIRFLLQHDVRLESISADVTSQINDATTSESQQADCMWLVYQMNETELGDGTITVLASGNTYPSGMYEVLDETMIVCETDLENPLAVVEEVDIALSVVTLVCVGVSVVCLIIRIILQFFIPSFSTRPGRIQLQVTVALLIAFTLLILGPFMSGTPGACTTAAILMAYGFLAAFTWMNVIAVDTWLVFRPSSAFTHHEGGTGSLKLLYALGWGIPVLLVMVSIVMNYVDVDTRFRPEFGGSRCWYTQRYAMLVYFGVPIALSIIVNIFLYVHTSINLHKAFKNARAAMKAESHHFAVYVKLFILMGITWIFGFISALTNRIVLDFLFVILNSLQGLFLFVCFVCNKRTLAEVKKTVTSGISGTSGLSTSERRTRSTVLSSRDSHHKNEKNRDSHPNSDKNRHTHPKSENTEV